MPQYPRQHMDPIRRRTILSTTTPETLNHFLSQPWCHPLLHDPTFTPVPTPSRTPHATTEDSFFAETLQSPRTIHSALSFYRTPSPTSPTETQQQPPFEEIRTLLSIGDGINGHAGIAHGGFLVTILDEFLGWAVYRHRNKGAMTATLSTDFKKPVRTPGTVLCSMRLESVEGRKLWVSGKIEDREGEVLVTAKGLWVEVEVEVREKARL